ncbi:hypothetical protein PF006_g29953 [Phytophthora fragariae]|uniref:Uncharacterized protein n=1 Tax=Phytophthora fragariae TaxID=53985 RepID=A0A6A3Q2F3_9STRA|nr:hypothetical protein PF006_g29953 [Phytophthora fragariae]
MTVPRLVSRAYNKVTQGEAAGAIEKLIFDQAIPFKLADMGLGYKTHVLWDRLVSNKLRKLLGGNVRFILSGSAPMSAGISVVMDFSVKCPSVKTIVMIDPVADEQQQLAASSAR